LTNDNVKIEQIDQIFKYIFVHGPNWLGSWEGQSISDICSGLTKVNSLHWDLDVVACEDLVNRKVHSSVVGAAVVMSALAMYVAMSACANATVNAALFSYMCKQ
jgi:hypothetical protein